MNYRDTLHRKARNSKTPQSWKNYKKQKNYVNNLIRKGKANHHKKLLDENISKPDKFWSYIKTLFPTKPKKENISTKFVMNEQIYDNNSDISNGFCTFFEKVASNLKEKSYRLKNFVWSTPKKLKQTCNSIFTFTYVSVPEVKQHLKELKRKKSNHEIQMCILRGV